MTLCWLRPSLVNVTVLPSATVTCSGVKTLSSAVMATSPDCTGAKVVALSESLAAPAVLHAAMATASEAATTGKAALLTSWRFTISLTVAAPCHQGTRVTTR